MRRFVTLVAFAFWQGGFAFYTAVVVPTGTEVLGSPLNQGLITRHVTRWINVTGLVALAPLAWDAAATVPWRRTRLTMCVVMAIALMVLWRLHPRLDALFDVEEHWVTDRPAFYRLHRYYLWTSTGQWLAGVVYLIFTPVAWRSADREVTGAR